MLWGVSGSDVREWDTKPSATVPGLSDPPVLDRRFLSGVPARLRSSLARSGCRNALDSGYKCGHVQRRAI
jgi:hypothetical protein